MRTLSEADVYRLPEGPIHSAVIGFSPLWIRPGLAGVAHTTPDELFENHVWFDIVKKILILKYKKQYLKQK